MATHYIVQWRAPDGVTRVSTMGKPTKEQALRQFTEDTNYFYDDIEIDLIEVTENVIKVGRGCNPRDKEVA